MNFDQIFAAYYTQYRLEATVPASTEDEYLIAIELANEAVSHFENYDATYWKPLFSSLQLADDGDKAVTTATSYDCPSDMREAGGFVRFIDAKGNTARRLPIIEPQDAQFRTDASHYCYFLGNPNSGFTMHINPAASTADVGLKIDYVYYKKATRIADGNTRTEVPNPYFLVHRMLANRFRGSRNPYYTTAKNEAENLLRIMQVENNSGTWADPWKVQDNSGTSWGI